MNRITAAAAVGDVSRDLDNGVAAQAYARIIEWCSKEKSKTQGKLLHARIIKCGLEENSLLAPKLLTMYCKFGDFAEARCVLDFSAHKKQQQRQSRGSILLWNAMLRGYSTNGFHKDALSLYQHMMDEGFVPDRHTLPSALKACAELHNVKQGRSIHRHVRAMGFQSDLLVANALITMYGKCGCLVDARQVFDAMPVRDIVTWNAMIAGYAQNEELGEAIDLLLAMDSGSVKPNSATIASVFPALVHGHGGGLRSRNRSIMNIEDARAVFDRMPKRDCVAWNAMIAGYVHIEQYKESVRLFEEMQAEGIKPDTITMVSVLPACAHLCALDKGRDIHNYILRNPNRIQCHLNLLNALIDMYGKCGSVVDARSVFDAMQHRDIVSWTALISGYGMHGHAQEAISLFSNMLEQGIQPDFITFVSLLSACSHGGLVEQGLTYFHDMSRVYNVSPRLEHYACMVDLLGRAGRLQEAYDLIQHMPLQPDEAVLGALLNACRVHKNIHLGQQAARALFKLAPHNSGYYLLLSNLYASSDMWDEALRVRRSMRCTDIEKPGGAGYSYIELHNSVHKFLVGDTSHPQTQQIYAMLNMLEAQMRALGYHNHSVGDEDDDDEDKEMGNVLYYHSEKLALSFGLINTKPGTTIRIAKNLCICGDCHTAIKFISSISERDIIVRDAKRFHRFRNGLCSCGDYW